MVFNNDFHIEIDYGSISNTFEGQRLDSIFQFERKDHVNDFSQTIFIDKTEFLSAEITSVDTNSLNLKVNSTNILVSNISVKGDTLTLKAKLPLTSHTVYFEGHDSDGELASILNDFRNGGEIEQRGWPVIFAAACLIAGLVDAYCDQQIANDVADCATNCMPAAVGWCGAECIHVCE